MGRCHCPGWPYDNIGNIYVDRLRHYVHDCIGDIFGTAEILLHIHRELTQRFG